MDGKEKPPPLVWSRDLSVWLSYVAFKLLQIGVWTLVMYWVIHGDADWWHAFTWWNNAAFLVFTAFQFGFEVAGHFNNTYALTAFHFLNFAFYFPLFGSNRIVATMVVVWFGYDDARTYANMILDNGNHTFIGNFVVHYCVSGFLLAYAFVHFQDIRNSVFYFIRPIRTKCVSLVFVWYGWITLGPLLFIGLWRLLNDPLDVYSGYNVPVLVAVLSLLLAGPIVTVLLVNFFAHAPAIDENGFYAPNTRDSFFCAPKEAPILPETVESRAVVGQQEPLRAPPLLSVSTSRVMPTPRPSNPAKHLLNQDVEFWNIMAGNKRLQSWIPAHSQSYYQ